MDNTQLVNLALQSFGNRTTLTAAQLTAGSNNEAKQANLTFENTRDSLLRLAPWDCGMKTANLTYITSVPGTPENTSAATQLWQPGTPRPPWAYEYQYPVDCLKACWVIPATQTGISGVPITTAVTGFSPSTWLGGPVPFKVATDEFFMAATATPVAGGAGYAIGDLITVALQPTAGTTNLIGTFVANAPQGAAAKLRVTNVAAGAVTAAVVVGTIMDDDLTTGSYFYTNAATATQGSTTGSGTGATFTLAFTPDVRTQRVILTNQEYATLCYVKRVEDPNVWDPIFQDAFVNALGGDLCLALSGDKALAKLCYAKANEVIQQARKADGNEGLTINDVTPDWIRTRGIDWPTGLGGWTGPYSSFDWGGLYGPVW